MRTNITTYGTLSGSNYTLTIPTEEGDRAPRSPDGLIVTRAVETRDGWIGQVYVDKSIVWEGLPLLGEDAAEHAVQAANTQVVKAVTHLFEMTEVIDREVEALAGDGE